MAAIARGEQGEGPATMHLPAAAAPIAVRAVPRHRPWQSWRLRGTWQLWRRAAWPRASPPPALAGTAPGPARHTGAYTHTHKHTGTTRAHSSGAHTFRRGAVGALRAAPHSEWTPPPRTAAFCSPMRSIMLFSSSDCSVSTPRRRGDSTRTSRTCCAGAGISGSGSPGCRRMQCDTRNGWEAKVRAQWGHTRAMPCALASAACVHGTPAPMGVLWPHP